MTKIHITGNAGAGKTTLARELATALSLPVFGLDKVVWQAGWVKTPPEIRAAKEAALIAKSAWVIEGVSQSVREAADVVIFLDVSRKTAFVRCIKRNWKFLFKGRPELPDNCPELRIMPYLIKIIWRFKAHVRPKILANINKNPSGRFIVRHGTDLKDVYQHLGLTK